MSAPGSLTVAIVGNPNAGKTSFFNKLTGSRQKVGNWPGVTVDKKTGWFEHQQTAVTLVDLPGIYSLSVNEADASCDERIASEYIFSGQADLLINILDASNLKRNLYLTTQLLELQIPMLVVVNMLDIAERRKIKIDLAALAAQLNCPVIGLVASKNCDLDIVKQAICQAQLLPPRVQHYHPVIEHALLQLANTHPGLEDFFSASPYRALQPRGLALRLLEGDLLALNLISAPQIHNLIPKLRAQIAQTLHEDCELLIAEQRYQLVDKLCAEFCTFPNQRQASLTQAIDRIVLNRYLGIPIFLLLMYLVFAISMNVGTLLQPLFDLSSKAIFIDGSNYLGQLLGLPWLGKLCAQSLGIGLNTLAKFIPQVSLLFLCLTYLEDSGYMARAAFVMDRFMQLAGLPGNAFVPLLIGFGCNVPAVMATRTLLLRDRIITCMMAPFMSCGARLAIFVVFVGTFFPRHPDLILFSLYLTGILVAILTGFLLKKTCFGNSQDSLVLELPIYHRPLWGSMLLSAGQKLRGFLFRSGKIIIPFCALLGILNSWQFNGQTANANNSIIASLGKAITPIFHPLGISNQNWPATVSLINGAIAKEVVIGSLNSLYAQNTPTAPAVESINAQLIAAWKTTAQGFKDLFSPSKLNPFTATAPDNELDQTAQSNMHLAFGSSTSAFAYLLFVLLYIPCISTIAAIFKEVGKFWSWASALWSLNIAYTIAVIFYQLSQFSQTPWTSSAWICGLLTLQLMIFGLLKLIVQKNQDFSHAIFDRA